MQVLERFAEFGWQPFVAPAETFEFFAVSGVFKRASVDVTRRGSEVVDDGSTPPHIAQRNALFDVCVKSGLAHIVVAYVRAEEHEAAAFGGARNYVLKEPIAVQQWVRRRVSDIESSVNELVAEQNFHGGHSHEEAVGQSLEEDVRVLDGMRMITMALIERLKDGTREFSRYSMVANGDVVADNISALEDTELLRLTTAGIHRLLELLTQIQSSVSIVHCLLWLKEHTGVTVDQEAFAAFYEQARSHRVSYREQFEEVYTADLSSVAGRRDLPMVLIEHVMQSAGIQATQFGGSSCPPTRLGQLIQLLKIPSIQEDVVAFYGAEVDREPIEGYFRVQVAIVLYFCLDRAYLGSFSAQVHHGMTFAHKMRRLADSLSAELCVRDDMKLTLLALWLIENAVAVKTASSEHVAALYEYAIGLLQQSSAMHLHQKYDLETDLIFHILETLVHRGECVFAWKVWNTFGLELDQSVPPAAAELAVVISLELDMWERALSLVRSQSRQDLLPLVFQWLTKSHRLKELVQGVTFLPQEEARFHAFMMDHTDVKDEDDAVLHYECIKRVDLLVMYYILRHKFKEAWDVHHEHLALIRSATAGNTHVATTVLNQPSFQIRMALLSNMCPEPAPREYKHKSARLALSAGSTNLGGRRSIRRGGGAEDHPMRAATEKDEDGNLSDESMEAVPDFSSRVDQASNSQSFGATGSFGYSPGVLSGKASQSRVSSEKAPSGDSTQQAFGVDSDVTPSPAVGKTNGVADGSIPSSSESEFSVLTRPKTMSSTEPRRLIFSAPSSPATFNDNRPFSASSSSVPSIEQPVAPFGGTLCSFLKGSCSLLVLTALLCCIDRRPLGALPIRSRLNHNFSPGPFAPPSPGVSNDGTCLLLLWHDRTSAVLADARGHIVV